MKLKYENQAAIQAKKILETYNGVFLADVVGLGKTFITAYYYSKFMGEPCGLPTCSKDYWKDRCSISV